MDSNMAMVLAVILACVVHISQGNRYDYDTEQYSPTRLIEIKQGKLRGRVVETSTGSKVEQYLGVPYAAPPVGQMRFMPTGAAPHWHGTKYAARFKPVCPQRLPSTVNMLPIRKKYFESLFAHLREQSEDCLYLNIYAPFQTEEERNRMPVMLFIHGESYEWNSGNAYDGSVLAAYGNVTVVTLNFRLGILGFLKSGLDERAQGNFGLIDQIAALDWIKENIAAFGGDPTRITVFGHGTGAACASLLMLSPMVLPMSGDDAKPLFRRAILMGGTALADWALARKPNEVTYQVAKKLNCPLGKDFLNCVRERSLHEIMGATAESAPYATVFGPIIDGVVIPKEPQQLIAASGSQFSQFDLMLGVTEIESLHLLDSIALLNGMLYKERDQELRKYLSYRCQSKYENCIDGVLSEYANLELALENPEFSASMAHSEDEALSARDTLLDVLSDARSVAPIVQTGRYHAAMNTNTNTNSETFFYVFLKATEAIEHIRGQTFPGEELPYVFGVPFAGTRQYFDVTYSEHERLLSAVVMGFWTNFAYGGNPNVPKRDILSIAEKIDATLFREEWPQFDENEQQYIYLNVPLGTDSFYRQDRLRFWNEDLPGIIEGTNEPLPPTKSRPTVIGRITKVGTPRAKSNFSLIFGFPSAPGDHSDDSVVYGSIKPAEDDTADDTTPDVQNILTRETPTSKSSAMSVLLTVGGIILLINMLLFVALYYKCSKLKNKSCMDKSGNDDPSDAFEEAATKTSKTKDTAFPENGCNLIKMISGATKSEDAYEAIKVEKASSSMHKLTRQMSNSTIDAHTKVREWIAQEVVQKYSPKPAKKPVENKKPTPRLSKKKPPFLRSDTKTVESNSTLGRSPTRPVTPTDDKLVASAAIVTKEPESKLPKSNQGSTEKMHKKTQKVSVAVDATPSGRGSSVLRQQPIELTKSLDCPTIERETEVQMRRSVTMEDICSPPRSPEADHLTKSTSNINVLLRQPQQTDVIQIKHFHSKSDPVQDLQYFNPPKKPLRTFDPNQDVNVTSRDSLEDAVAPLTPEQALMTIKRRNFPKVLPDYPMRTDLAQKRRSMPVPNALFMPIPEIPSLSQPTSPTEKIYCRFRPVPPPRISSTLGRKPSVSTTPSPVCSSSPMLAEEPPIPEEPEVTCNNLYVGPLKRPKPEVHGSLPHKLDTQKIYETLRPQRSEEAIEKKSAPKAIVTTDPDNPVRRVEPKIVIKPGTNKNMESNRGKVIPRVTMNDIAPDMMGRSTENISCSMQQSLGEIKDTKGRDTVPSGIPVKKTVVKGNTARPSQIPMPLKTTDANATKESSSSDSTPSEESDTGTVKRAV